MEVMAPVVEIAIVEGGKVVVSLVVAMAGMVVGCWWWRYS